jgi:hypothetical protein
MNLETPEQFEAHVLYWTHRRTNTYPEFPEDMRREGCKCKVETYRDHKRMSTVMYHDGLRYEVDDIDMFEEDLRSFLWDLFDKVMALCPSQNQ